MINENTKDSAGYFIFRYNLNEVIQTVIIDGLHLKMFSKCSIVIIYYLNTLNVIISLHGFWNLFIAFLWAIFQLPDGEKLYKLETSTKVCIIDTKG